MGVNLMPYENVSYQAFACPKCGDEINPSESIFCENCGENLSMFGNLAKKTFYESVYFDKKHYCKKCGKRGPKKTIGNPVVHRDYKISNYERRGEYYSTIKCGLCGEEYEEVSDTWTYDIRDDLGSSGT